MSSSPSLKSSGIHFSALPRDAQDLTGLHLLIAALGEHQLGWLRRGGDGDIDIRGLIDGHADRDLIAAAQTIAGL